MKKRPVDSLPPEGLPLDQQALTESFINHVQHTRGKHPSAATPLDQYHAAARAVRDRMFDRWTRTWRRYKQTQPKRVYYLSLEYLLGRLLQDGLLNLGILDETRAALAAVGVDLDRIAEEEYDAGLGNGGLGRLAACYLDSMATLGVPGMGYGIRYEFGIFRQDIVNGTQVERPDNWLRFGNVWEVVRPERTYPVQFGGRVIQYTGPRGRHIHDWVDAHQVFAVAYDVPVPGYRNDVVNTLRLWSAKATRAFDISYFNRGDYIRAIENKANTENLSRVLYPNDSSVAGRELRLKQEYFLVSATLQDCVRRHLGNFPDLANFDAQAVFQLNDTHPALSVAELMRLFVDEHGMAWNEAFRIVRGCLAYTNHTILPEALEKWPVWLMERVLPRHLQIIYEINHEMLQDVRKKYPDDLDRVRTMSIIQEGRERQVRMANLAVVGCRCVNGVSELHSTLLRTKVFPEFDEYFPGRFTNQTNGVTPRRWLLHANPGLAQLISSRIGDGWITDLERLAGLEECVGDSAFREQWCEVKRENKRRLARYLGGQFGIELDPTHLFDAQVKRIHEYKRQSLNVLHAVSIYLRLRSGAHVPRTARTIIIGGKAAPGYQAAKLLIQLIVGVSKVVNADRNTRDRLRVVFVPNYGVTLAEHIIPASDVSEQISVAGMEASGTGNMKFALNGALTVGTLDGATIEMKEAIGAENMFLFGLTADEVEANRADGYDPSEYYYGDDDLRAALDAIADGMFSPDKPDRFRGFVDQLIWTRDPYMVLADFKSYARCHRTVEEAHRDSAGWTRASILNVARMGRFSSDRAVRGYAREIWNVPVG